MWKDNFCGETASLKIPWFCLHTLEVWLSVGFWDGSFPQNFQGIPPLCSSFLGYCWEVQSRSDSLIFHPLMQSLFSSLEEVCGVFVLKGLGFHNDIPQGWSNVLMNDFQKGVAKIGKWASHPVYLWVSLQTKFCGFFFSNKVVRILNT